MNLHFNKNNIGDYKSGSQIARIITEGWVHKNCYCPNCGEEYLNRYAHNKPVADFYCKKCKEDYELKSKKGDLTNKINDGAYRTMIQRITSRENPNFFFLTYDFKNLKVNDFLIIPNYFFVPQIIEKRKPLSATAKRAGWIGCNISLTEIPSMGRIFLVKKQKEIDREEVLSKWKETRFIQKATLEGRGWTVDVLNCIDKIPSSEFDLSQIYKFENTLKQRHPNNNFVKDKIRQQLQVLRDKGILEFVSRGKYRKTIQ